MSADHATVLEIIARDRRALVAGLCRADATQVAAITEVQREADACDAGAAALRRGTCATCAHHAAHRLFPMGLCYHVALEQDGAPFESPTGFGCTLYRGKTDDEKKNEEQKDSRS